MNCLTSADIDRLAVADFDQTWFIEVVFHTKECDHCRALLQSIQVSPGGKWRVIRPKQSIANRLYRRIWGVVGGMLRPLVVSFNRGGHHENQGGQESE